VKKTFDGTNDNAVPPDLCVAESGYSFEIDELYEKEVVFKMFFLWPL
jgi:hypothetical protein